MKTAAPVYDTRTPVRFRLPQPNAFDGCVEAARLFHENADDAWQLDEAYRAEYVPFPSSPGSKGDSRRKQFLVEKNEIALNRLRAALRLPYHEPPDVEAKGDYPYLHTYRPLARLCIADGDVKREAGNDLGALMAYLDAVAFGQMLPRGGPFITRLVGIAVQSIGRRPLWKHLNMWNADTARRGAKRMETILAAHVPMAETWNEEKYFGRTGRIKRFQNVNELAHTLFSSELARHDEPPPASLWEKIRTHGLVLVWGKPRLLNGFTRYMDACIENSRLPYARQTAVPLPADPLNRRTLRRSLSIFDTTALKDVSSSQTQNALLCAAFALQACRAETGCYPAALSELVTRGVLSNVPIDPFSPDGAAILRYRRDSLTEMVLWSVGPDGTDENGTPINDTTKTGNARFFVFAESKGDLVAGTNIF